MVSPSRRPPEHPDFESWIRSLDSAPKNSSLGILRHAYEIAAVPAEHETDVMLNERLLSAFAVADTVSQLLDDPEVIAVPLLCAAIAAGTASNKDIAKVLNVRVAELADDVWRLDAISDFLPQRVGERPDPQQLEHLRKLLLSLAKDVRVVLVKLAERLHTMRSLRDVDPDEQIRIARETLDIFAPLANRLGIGQIKWELEDLAFRYLRPERYKEVAALIDERRSDREQYIDSVVERLDTVLTRQGVHSTVYGRVKHIYSIWRKMLRKQLRFEELFDVRAVRIMVDDVAACYTALGIVHSLWPPIRKEFDDYIANPKENGYQSLHTAVVGPGGKTVEVQIRTHSMHTNAELGVAAHWRYKEGPGAAKDALEARIAWLRRLLETGDEEESDLLDRFQSEAFQDRVYVFTPQGDILDLPQGATPLDFAYKLHSDVGHRCRGAKVNGRIVPLGYELKNGERIEVLTAREGGPSRDWLNANLGYLRTSRARSKVRHWFRHADHSHNVSAGKTAVEREFSRLGIRDVRMEHIVRKLGYETTEQLHAAVGFGDVSLAQIVGSAQEQLRRDDSKEPVLPVRGRARADLPASDIQILGVGNLLTQIATCCKPVPRDRITGYITQGRGVSIHRQDCPNLLALSNSQPQRIISVDWGWAEDRAYPVEVSIVAYDRTGLLKDITTLLAAERINVVAVQTLSHKETTTADMHITLEVTDVNQLARVLDRLSRLPNVMEARRSR